MPSAGGEGSSVCRMHGAGEAAPKGGRNALKHGGYIAERQALRALLKVAKRTLRAI
jgi:hypothetical protein